MENGKRRIMRLDEVLAVTGAGAKTTLDDWERRGDFPRRRKLGRQAIGWYSDEVEAWVNSRPVALLAGDGAA